jgi:hypothetical protein
MLEHRATLEPRVVFEPHVALEPRVVLGPRVVFEPPAGAILVKNVDIICSLPARPTGGGAGTSSSFLNFTAPRTVEVCTRALPPIDAPDLVLVRSRSSMISSGTELKIYKGTCNLWCSFLPSYSQRTV